ncbi:MAG: hypothetical protein P8M04_00015 [Akkermansiaceae bacterium]|nr:hypothetical protein [Akkermansiaceae bacterium]
MKILVLSFVASLAAAAAPSVYLDGEIHLPLESKNGILIIDRSSGQLRRVVVDASNKVVVFPSVHSGLPLVTGATSGYFDGDDEAAVLTSVDSNRLSFVNTVSGFSSPLFADRPAPEFVAQLHRAGGATRDLIVTHSEAGVGDALNLRKDPAGSFSSLDLIGSAFGSFSGMQDLYDDFRGDRYAIGVENGPGLNRIVYLNQNAGKKIEIGFGDKVAAASLVASNIRRDDNTLMVATYLPGTRNINLFEIFFPLVNLDAATKVILPKRITSMAAAPEGLGAGGFVVTYFDGTGEYFTIDGANSINSVQTFEPSGEDPFRGLLPISSRGVLGVYGAGGSSTTFDFFGWNGSGFVLKDSGSLASLRPAAQDSPTLFWFSKEPLVDPTATLLQLDRSPDWTSKSSPVPLPPNVFVETFADPAAGLDNPISTAPAVPPGSGHLLTNQISDTISLTAFEGKLALSIPPINVSPESGLYQDPVQATVLVDDDLYRVFYREVGSSSGWKNYLGPVTVVYPSSWQFYTENINSGAFSPIVMRTYTFDSDQLRTFDTDADGVPDFVEQEYGLTSNSGPDADADGYSDLDEIINGSDPNDDASEPLISTNPFLGEGIRILAQAFNTGASKASDGLAALPEDGELINLHSMTSGLLASAPVQILTSPAVLSGQLAASLKTNSSVSVNELLVLNSPEFFFLNGVSPEVRGGREIYKLISHPDQQVPEISPVLSGSNQSSDAAIWVADAAAAYSSFEQVSTITDLEPIDTAVAVLVEAALFNALSSSLTTSEQIALGFPQLIPADPGPPALPQLLAHSQFTLFGKRFGDSERTHFNLLMQNALIAKGLSYEELLSEISASIADASELPLLVEALYDFHVAHSGPTAPPVDVIPLLPLPLDALRMLIRDGTLPSEYSGGSFPPQKITDSFTEMETALGTLSNAYRPTAEWVVEVKAPTLPGDTYLFEKTDDFSPVRFFEIDGDPLNLDQGLGLALGTRYRINGYTDVTTDAPYIGMEVFSIEVISVPLVSDNDANANLLGDDWEEFFFGSLGVVGPYDLHPVNGFTYLQLYLIGFDPRDDNTEIPAVSAVTPAITNFKLLELSGSKIGIHFDFPEEYIGSFSFVVQRSEDLGITQNYTNVTVATPTSLGGNSWEFDLGVTSYVPDSNFFRIGLALPSD